MTKRKDLDAIVFDFGGVLTTSASPFRVKPIVEGAGLPWSAVTDAFAKYRRAYDIGDITVGEFYARAWREAGLTVEPSVEAAIEEADTSSFLYRNERTIAWMRELKTAGYRLGILTNMPHELAPRFKEAFSDALALADALVISCEVHLVKPTPEIYRLLEARLGNITPEHLLFFDDSEINCAGARAVGWRAIRFLNNAQAEEALAKNGMSVSIRHLK